MTIKRLVKYWAIFVVLFVTFDLPFDLGGYGIMWNKADLNYVSAFWFLFFAGVGVALVVVADTIKGDK